MRDVQWWAFAVLIGTTRIASAKPDALDKPAFAATPNELLAAASSTLGGDSDAIVLRDETSYTFDDKGRSERHWRVVFAIRKASAVDGWGTLSLHWSPFYQDKPVIRARVVAPGGQVAELDQSLINDAPAVSESPSVFSDRRQLEAPLPRLAIGSVVEEDFVITDREPLLSAGVVYEEAVGRGVAVAHTIVTVSAPTAASVHVVAQGFAKPPVPRRTTSHGRTTWAYDFGLLDPRKPFEEGMPSDVDRFPMIAVSTGASWGAVAQDYRRLVDQRLRDGAFQSPVDLKQSSERATVDRAVAWLHQHVRYTGIEFSDAAIVPWPPSETAKRGFGDCKDKASLLVSILRGAGIRADLALLSAGPGRDVARDVPGMGTFDHAIVRARVDGKDLWIDATESDLPAGQLPARDQGRRALVIAPETNDLVVTPKSLPADNVIREVRTFRLAEHDQASATEVDSETGVFTDRLRSWVREHSHDDAQESLSEYAQATYHGKLASFSNTDPGDLAHPFSLIVEIEKTNRAFTKRQLIDVYVFAADTLARVPRVLDRPDEDHTDRQHDFGWYEPHVYEIENRLVLPPGYTMPQLSAHDQQALGTMTLTTDRRVDHDTLVITYRLDTGKLRMSAAEVTATREAIRELHHRDAEHVVIAHTAWALEHQGKLKEAIAECQRMIALHPKEARHWDELADMYREAGMGSASRRAAKQAIEVEPTSDAYDILAFELTHDTLGRQYGFDTDRKGAIAAYRKSLGLNPDHAGALRDFATLLVHNDIGQLTTDAKDRREALALWRHAKDIAKSNEYDVPIASQLFLLGEFAEAEATARAMPESKERSMILVAAVAAERGADAASTLASSLSSQQDRKQVLTAAMGMLMVMRRYDLARKLFDEAKDADSNPLLVTVMAKAAVVDLGKLDPADPRTAVLWAFAVMTGEPSPHAAPWDVAVEKRLRDGFVEAKSLPGMSTFRAMPRVVVDDLMAALAQITVEGTAATGWRVVLDVGVAKLPFYIVAQRGRATIIGVSEAPEGVGGYVQGLLSKGDRAGAQRWMSWVIQDLQVPGLRTPPMGFVKPFDDELRKLGKDAAPKELLELGAGFLMAVDKPDLAIAVLRRCTTTSDDLKKQCQISLARALFARHQWADAAEVSHQLHARTPSEPGVLESEAVSLAAASHVAEAVKLIDDALAARPDDVHLLRARGRVAVIAGDWADARSRLDTLLAHSQATVGDFNDAAWLHLYRDPTPVDAHVLAQRAERMNTTVSGNLANTIAAIEAESDRPSSAWTYLQKSLAGSADGKPRDADWYVIGRIAECYGLRDDAIAAYHRVAKAANELGGATAYDFAQRRLAQLATH